MTDQSSNDQFHASSFMQGANAAYLEQLYARYANDPGAVDEAWKKFFDDLGDRDDAPRRLAPPGRAPTGRRSPRTS
jgi:2-oxoglutarate dehydrogenase E1 component